MDNIIYLVIAVAAALLLYYYNKAKCLFRALLFSVVSGGVALLVLVALNFFADLAIKVTPFTTTISFIWGIPGLGALLLFSVI